MGAFSGRIGSEIGSLEELGSWGADNAPFAGVQGVYASVWRPSLHNESI